MGVWAPGRPPNPRCRRIAGGARIDWRHSVLGKRPAQYRNRKGQRVRARIHALGAPLWDRARRQSHLRALAIVLVLLVAGAGVADVEAERFLATLPSVKGLDAASLTGDTFVYDRSGNLLADLGNQGNHRQYLQLKDISPHMQKATIDIEDRNFYKNSGFDLSGIARAAYENLRYGHTVQGGSTITQQLAKGLLLTPEQSYQRKAKEIVLAYEISQTYSKTQILELYLNNSYYGEQAYGVEAASKIYFRTDAKQLDIAEAAMLAGLPQSPTELDPVLHPAAARARQEDVLQALLTQGDITQAEYTQALAEKLDFSPPVNNFKAPHFDDYVQKELVALGFHPGQEQLFVTTTLDWGKQQIAERDVRENLQANLYRDSAGQLDSALVAMDPHNGQILAMVGSADYNRKGGQYNYVADVPRNPGSSYKVFTYTAAIESRKTTMETLIVDGPSPYVVPMPSGAPYQVYNYTHGTYGTLPLRVAFASSLNIPAVKTELAIGVPAVLQFSRNVGLHPMLSNGDGTYTVDGPMSNYGPSLTLGGYPVTLLDEVAGLSTIADMGVYHAPEAILSVKDARGHILYQADPNASRKQVVDPGAAFITAEILNDDNNRALIFGHNSTLHLSDRQSAAKTGTNDDFKDGLTIGFTPDLATVVWMGDTLGNQYTMSRGSDGVYVAAPLWHRFMEEALAGVPDRWYSPPSDVVKGDGAHRWFLADQRNVPSLNGGSPSPSPSPTASVVPADPGVGPTALIPSPNPTPSLPNPSPSPHR